MLVDISRALILAVPVLGFYADAVRLREKPGALKFPPPLTAPIGAAIGVRLLLAALLVALAAPVIDLPAAFLLVATMPAAGRLRRARARVRARRAAPPRCHRVDDDDLRARAARRLFRRLMRALVQRVSRTSSGTSKVSEWRRSARGCVLLGVTHEDAEADADRLADKVRALRIFPDGDGRMNEPLGDRGALRLPVHPLRRRPQGQPAGLRGRRAARARRAAVRALLRAAGRAARRLGAMMDVALVNDGPVTLLVEVP